MTAKSIQAKNRIKNLEAAQAKTMTDARNLYAIALHQREYINQQKAAADLLTGVAAMSLAFLAGCFAWLAILHEVNK